MMFINKSKSSPTQSYSFCPRNIHTGKVTLITIPRRLLLHSQLRGVVNVLLSTCNSLLSCNSTPKFCPTFRAGLQPTTLTKPSLTNPQLPLYVWSFLVLSVTLQCGYY